jgi:cold shock CspA family protein
VALLIRITDRGFGFITAPDGIEYFFHPSACIGTPFDFATARP